MLKTVTVLVGIACAATLMEPTASADPTAGHGTRVHVQNPAMLCQIGSDDADPGVGSSVVCQGIFPDAPVEPCPTVPGQKCPEVMHEDQAVVTAAGRFTYRDANIGVGDNPVLDTLTPGQTYLIQGWAVTARQADITFTHNLSGHGMTIAAGGSATAF